MTSKAVGVAPGGAVLLCDMDLHRVGLILGVSGVNSAAVSTRKDMTGTQGHLLSSGGTSVLPLDFERFGPLVGQAWYGLATAGTTVEVTEVLREYDPDNPLWMRWNPNDRPVSE